MIINLVGLGIFFWLVNKGLWKVVDQAFEEPPLSPVVAPEVSFQEPWDSCDKVCSPACQEFFDAALATISAQQKPKSAPKR